MTFVNFSLLAGTALVALPIVLHLIMRQKPQRLEFPALRFIQKRHETNRRRLRLRHLLLLLLRAAAIALLAFALARPSVKLAGMLASQEAPVAAALVFDTAPRMEYRQENQTRLEVAKRLGVWLLAQLPQESQTAVLDTRLGQAVFQADRGAAKERIQRLETVGNSQPLTVTVEEALRLVAKSDLARKEIYIFTDLSRGAWPVDAASRLRDRLAAAAGVGIYVIDVGVANPTNYALGSVRLSSQVLSSRSSVVVETELSRSAADSTAAPQQRTVELYMLDANRQPQKAREQTYTVEPGKSQQVEFRLSALGVGTHQGFLRIVGQDGLACDDTRYFTFEVKRPWRILVAAPKPADKYALFLVQALSPAGFRKRGEARFDCDVVDLAELSRRTLDDYAAVCLLDPTPLDPAVWQKLGDFASGGRGLAIFLGRNAVPVDSFNAAQAQELLPGKLLRQARRPEGDCYLAPRQLQHPILSAFRGEATSIPWPDMPVFRYWELGKLAAGVGVVLPLSDQQPVLLERPLNTGRVLTMTTPVSDRPSENPWNLLPAGADAWPFVILVNQMMAYLVGSSEQQLNYFAGQLAVLPLELESQRRTFVLTAPGDLSMPLAADPQQHQLTISATEQPGNYRVRGGGSVPLDTGFSVNLAPEQSELQRISQAELNDVFGPVHFRLARTKEQIDRDVSIGRVGRELFSPLIFAVAFALALEHVLATWFYKEG